MESIRSAANAFAITKSDSDTFSSVRALYIGTEGDVAVKFPGNPTAVVFKNVPSGTILPLQVSQVMSTSTTATDIVGLR